MLDLYSAHLFSGCVAAVVLFQMALACGAPWGRLAMGGRYPGRFPARLRIAAVAQALVIVLLGVVVETRAGTIFPEHRDLAAFAIWGVVIICALSLVMNLATPSKWERILWTPVAFVMLVTSTRLGLMGGA